MTSYAGTASGPRLGSRCSDEEMGGEQRASVPVVLDDSNPDAVIDDVASQLPTAESVPAISSKSSVNPARGAQGAQGAEGAQDAQDMDTADVASVRFQPIPSHDDDLAGIPQRRAAKTQPSRHAQSLSAPSHPATQTQTPSINTDIPSLTVVSSTPVSPTAPESFGPTQEDRLPPTGRSTPVNDRDRRQSRRRSVMDVSLPCFFSPTSHMRIHPPFTAQAIVQYSRWPSHTICVAARYALSLTVAVSGPFGKGAHARLYIALNSGYSFAPLSTPSEALMVPYHPCRASQMSSPASQ